MEKAASIGIIGGADGPTAIFLAGNYRWLGIIAIAAVVAGVAALISVIITNDKRK